MYKLKIIYIYICMYVLLVFVKNKNLIESRLRLSKISASNDQDLYERIITLFLVGRGVILIT